MSATLMKKRIKGFGYKVQDISRLWCSVFLITIWIKEFPYFEQPWLDCFMLLLPWQSLDRQKFLVEICNRCMLLVSLYSLSVVLCETMLLYPREYSLYSAVPCEVVNAGPSYYVWHKLSRIRGGSFTRKIIIWNIVKCSETDLNRPFSIERPHELSLKPTMAR